MRESSHRPLIFGTPFLSTVGAIFDFPNQRISFNKVNKGMFFPMCSTKNSFVDMVQEEKVTLKPPQEGETEDKSRKIPFLSPSSLPTSKDCESPTRYSLQGEKTWRIKDASSLHLLLSAKPYSQAKDLKQALHGRQPMRIEGEKGVKTQSAPNIGRGRAKNVLAEQFPTGPTVPVEPGRNSLCSAGLTLSRDRNRPRSTHGQRRNGRARPDFCIGTDRPLWSIRETNDRPRPKFSSTRDLADQIARPRRNLSAKVSPLFINSNRF
ncbi:unnamed protein product [Microthlaspi erraticum]|uniref:Uncharacterized protein n=1 Tax=Microthlaspi erraticum TaxID=1685480 RepID=A0A6D2L398_9BRAS|nr:unnamed protein product [Microthlaspi erraticum]